MASFKIDNVRVSGISACVPDNKVDNLDHSVFSSREDAESTVKKTGVRFRPVASESTCTTDLAVAAVDRLLLDLDWDKNDVEVLVLVTQTPDYSAPISGSIVQHKAGLPKQCYVIDIPLGCSGYVYGLSNIASIIAASGMKKGILIAGDTLSKQASSSDRSTAPLFSDVVTATAVEYDAKASYPLFFEFGTDGSGYDAIIINDGGYRNPATASSLVKQNFGDGVTRRELDTSMDGMNVFSFAITTAPKSLKGVLKYSSMEVSQLDYVVFHQANLFMNELIRKKMKLTVEQVPYSLHDYGNSASATIPITLVSQLQDALKSQALTIGLCGFGIGLSWGSAILSTNKIIVSDIVIYGENE